MFQQYTQSVLMRLEQVRQQAPGRLCAAGCRHGTSSRPGRGIALYSAFALAGVVSTTTFAQEADVDDLMSMSIEDLMTMEVTSVSKQSEKMMEASAAIFVITGDDIRQSGAQNIPEALRMVPGMQVSRIDKNKYAVSARGFNDVFSNKLLVLIDGRSVYTPSFSGVFWESHDLVLADIARIEVIRGPGATLWGANAVGGVINIITKDAAATIGTLTEVQTSDGNDTILSLRHGIQMAPTAWVRGYLKYSVFEESELVEGANDDGEMLRGGFRFDWVPDSVNRINVQGDFFSGESGTAFTAPTLTAPYAQNISSLDDQRGGSVQIRWTREKSNGSNMSLQAYYDVDDREAWGQGIENKTIDLEFQHGFRLTEQVRMTWGLGYRSIEDEYTDSPAIIMTPPRRTTELLSGFVQAEVTLLDEAMKVTFGSKFEENDFTGLEVQPSVRVAYTEDDMTWWGSVAMASRTPSRSENDFLLNIGVVPPFTFLNPGPNPMLMQIVGNEDLGAEELTAFEVGVRKVLNDNLWIDATGYFDHYHGIVGTVPGVPTFNFAAPVPHLAFPLNMANVSDVEVTGFELSGTWRVSRRADIKFAYTWTDVTNKSHGVVPGGDSSQYAGPAQQASVRANVALTDTIDLNIWTRYVSDIEFSDVDAYADLNVRLAWQVNDKVELAIIGKNLIEDFRWEAPPHAFSFINTPVERSVFAVVRVSLGD